MNATDQDHSIVTAVIGTAGHVDHGKSTLLEALTGTDPMRLVEEQRRGMTIEIGFAHLELPNGQSVGFIDVPGHEGLIKTMIAGASGIDVVLLVVAADDGAMPQTREHLAICEYLGIERGVLAITKADLIDAELLPLLEEDLRELAKGTFLAEAPVIHTSAKTGLGIDELRETLLQLAQTETERDVDGPFYMPIQRVFTLSGHGTVVTGVPSIGTVKVGDELRIAHADAVANVRSLQVHGAKVTEGHAGHRLALNLRGVSPDQCRRGDVLAAKGFYAPTETLIVSLSIAPGAWPMSDGDETLVHVGTAERLGTVRLIGAKDLAEGDEGYAQLILNHPVCVPLGVPIVLRRPSPAVIWGGGRVLDRGARRIRHRLRPEAAVPYAARAAALDDFAARVRTVIREGARHGAKRQDLPARADRSAAECRAVVARFVAADEVLEDPKTGLLIERAVWDELTGSMVEATGRHHRDNPEIPGPSGAHIAHIVGCPAPFANRLIRACLDARAIREIHGGRIVVADSPPVPEALREDAAALAEFYTRVGLTAPMLANLAEEFGAEIEPGALRLILAHHVRTGLLHELADTHFVPMAEMTRAREALVDGLREHGMMSVVSFREILPEISNRVAKELLDFFDLDPRIERRGNFRYLKGAPPPSDPAPTSS